MSLGGIGPNIGPTYQGGFGQPFCQFSCNYQQPMFNFRPNQLETFLGGLSDEDLVYIFGAFLSLNLNAAAMFAPFAVDRYLKLSAEKSLARKTE